MDIRASDVRDIWGTEDDVAHAREGPKQTLFNAKNSSAVIVVATKFLFLVCSFLPKRKLLSFFLTTGYCFDEGPSDIHDFLY